MITIVWAYIERRIAIIQSLNVTDITSAMRDKIYEKIGKNNLLAYEDNQQYNALLKALNYTDVGADEVTNIFFRFLTCILTIIGVSYVIGEVSFIMIIIIIASLLLAHLCMKKVNKLLFEYQNNERLPKVRLVNYFAGLFHNKDYIAEMKLNNAFGFAIESLKSKLREKARKKTYIDLSGIFLRSSLIMFSCFFHMYI